jgi:UDP-N-acetylmuramyl pentapeptide phosphotransferase/UDP-N-acetylglucosamine-1-phosphate transferase
MKLPVFYIILFLFSFILTFVIRKLAITISILDVPSERSSHKNPTPKGGGLAVAVVWFTGLLYFYLTKNIDDRLFFSFLPGILLVVIGIIDDIVAIRPLYRLIFQFIVSSIAVFMLGGLEKLDLGFYVVENRTVLTVLALLGTIWFINLFNFLDGIDGYIGMEVVFISSSMILLFNDRITPLLLAATLGFLIWNWQPAKIFIGDVGSTLLGFNIAIFSIYYQNISKSSLLIWLMLSSLFWFDATLTLYRRYRHKEPLIIPHRKHAFHRIVKAGFSHQKTVLLGFAINLVILLITYISVRFRDLIVPLLVLDMLLLYLVTRQIDKKMKFA